MGGRENLMDVIEFGLIIIGVIVAGALSYIAGYDAGREDGKKTAEKSSRAAMDKLRNEADKAYFIGYCEGRRRERTREVSM
jgi:hypothetical protein